MLRKLAPLALFLALALAASAASAVHFSFSSDVNISIDDDRVILSPHDAPRAEIAPSGDLRIDGQLIAVPLKDRLLLARYNQSVRTIVSDAVHLGVQGASLGVQALTAALVGLATGDEGAAKRAVEPKAEKMKERGREICLEARTLRMVQEEIAADVPAFRPYALIDSDAGSHCHVDD
jgi:hypothetical protein